MTLPEETPVPPEEPKPEAPETPQAEFPEETSLPEGFVRIEDSRHLSRARRRRANRTILPPGADERAAFLAEIARRAFPSVEFFLLALISGLILGAAYLFDSQALLLLGLLLAPILAPWLGMTLSAATGSLRFFMRTLGGLLIGGLLIFLSGTLAGLAGRLWPGLNVSNAVLHSHLWWWDLLLTLLGAVLFVLGFLHPEHRPVLPNLMLAYGLFLPLSAAGVGLGMQKAPIFPDGVLVCLVHLALATLAGGITLLVLKFKPAGFSGAVIAVLEAGLCLAALVFLTGLAGWVTGRMQAGLPQGIPTPLALASPTLGTVPTVTQAYVSPTPQPSPTSTLTLTPTSTPAYAVIHAVIGGGALVRSLPGATGTVVATLVNGNLVEIVSAPQVVNNNSWVSIRGIGSSSQIQGWVLSSVLLSVTQPAPTIPLATSTATP